MQDRRHGRHAAVDSDQLARLAVGTRRYLQHCHRGRRQIDVSWCRRSRGLEDIHYMDRLLAQLEAKAGLKRPILLHAILETARGVANVEEICGASPRMQGLSLGPADLAANRRMKTTRVGGGHPGYLVRQDPTDGDINGARTTYQQDLWHYTIARMVDACVTHGILLLRAIR
ncbi:MAG: aldolase/citrate lyase family protein [Acidimicrobiales bacterium]